MLDPREYCFSCMNPLPKPDGKCPVCGKDNTDRRNGADELPFCLLARKYVVGRSLGRGGFGITYIGLSVELGRRVAIKEYFPDEISARAADRIHLCASAPEYEAMLRAGTRKALEEARMVARIQEIPHVMRVYDCLGRNNTVYIVMEYIEGENLAEQVARKGRMSWEQAWPLMKPIGEALRTFHGMGMVHRDISPDNIMIRREDGQSVLLDFGAASEKIDASEQRDKLLKDGYAAPEQYSAEAAIDGRADQYSWAATLLFLLTGKRPETAPQRQFTGPEELRKQLNKYVPEQAREPVFRAMEVEPDARYASMTELLEALEPGKEEPAEAREKSLTAVWICAALSALGCAGSVAIGLLGG